ncbi:MAG TPA: S-layer homology domain-containing protein [Candidatus Avoscillospira stercorigallinarum]|uniref:S-layer homology domain-containing protein n=1 Tax=Candidatus Avoscillospira stercorigallinarum TaxID=2840708 RepID=A0A9D0Z6B1_9FIRM|nr:S-layer homology domain-containing protein [Candidatus Avoscillospira stercorigallinarum]
MKKSITRIGALLLVLALLVSVAPFALAADAINISGESQVKVEETITLSTDYSGTEKVQWSMSGDGATGEESTDSTRYTVTGETAGTTVTVTASVTENGETISDTHEIHVVAAEAAKPTLTITGANTLEYSKTAAFTAAMSDGSSTEGIAWSSSDSAVADVSETGVVTAKAATGTATISAKVGETKSNEITVTVTKMKVTPQIDGVPAAMNLTDKDKTLSVSFAEVEDLEPTSVTWTSSDATKLAVDDKGVLTPKATGKATITATVTLTNDLYELKTNPVTSSEITVGGVVLSVSAPASVERLDSITLVPTVNGLSSDAVVNYTFDYKSSDSGKVTGASTSVSTSNKGAVSVLGSSVGVASVTVTASVANNSDIKIDPVTVYIGVYETHTVEASTDSWKLKLSEVGALKTLYKDNGSNTASRNSLMNALGAADGTYIKFDIIEGKNVGSFSSGSGWVSVNNSALTFTAVRSGTVTAEYTVAWADSKTKTDHVVAEGTLKLTVGDGEGDIEYDLGSNGKVTFDEKDFVSFWNDNKSANKYTGSLSYVKFDITTSVPYYGILYTTSSASKVVTTSHKAYYNYSATNNNYYCDLDQVTYVVDTKNYDGLTDTVPFTAYNDKGDGISGIIVINLGEGDAATITSRGVAFGAGGITEIIEANYKAATGKDLDYLTFSSVSASSGKLFYNFSNILNSTPVTTKYEFYVDPTGTQMDLDKVAFVPRAGLYGEVSIKYTGYDVNGKNSYEGKITFKVTQKTKSAVFSDVTATSYSWAADSVDFLYYEEVANGSNGKYNPKSNITRGDFMLMLYRAFLEEDYGNYNVTSNFPDVVKGTTSYSKETYQAVGVAKYLGIAQGSNGKYNPTSYITREEAMTLIYRTLDEVGYSMSYTVSTSTSSFSDYSSVSSYAKAAIKDLIGHGVVIGTNGKIQPKSNITRAEMAVILHRVLTY